MNKKLILLFLSIVNLFSIFATHDSKELFKACRNGDHEKVYELIKANVDINVRDKFGNMPLHIAINPTISKLSNGRLKIQKLTNGHLKVVELLIKNGALIDAIDNNGNTPLDRALFEDASKEMVELLLKNGADVKRKKSYNRTYLFNATNGQKYRNTDFIDILLSAIQTIPTPANQIEHIVKIEPLSLKDLAFLNIINSLSDLEKNEITALANVLSDVDYGFEQLYYNYYRCLDLNNEKIRYFISLIAYEVISKHIEYLHLRWMKEYIQVKGDFCENNIWTSKSFLECIKVYKEQIFPQYKKQWKAIEKHLNSILTADTVDELPQELKSMIKNNIQQMLIEA